MKNIQILIIFLFCIGILPAQNISEINSDLKLSDSLTHDYEVRIYQDAGITNYSSLFRMFKDKSEKWTAEFYKHYAKVSRKAELQIEKQTLKSKNEMEFVFQNFIRSHIIYLPSLSKIKWKLVGRGNVEKVKRVIRGKKIEEYLLMNNRIESLDGEGYKVQFRAYDKKNEFEYSNPEEYLKYYPEIDELIYMCEIIDLIRNEFKIWEK